MTSDSSRRLLAAAGSVVMALLASACCWVPLLFVGLGVLAVGISASLEAWRPVFLGATAVFLGVGFYFAYFRKKPCEPGAACAANGRSRNRIQRITLWCATIVALTVSLFPHYAGNVLRALHPGQNVAAEGRAVELSIVGMTCDACSVAVERELLAVPGVVSSSADYSRAHATIRIADGAEPTDQAPVDAVKRAGYEAALQRKPAPEQFMSVPEHDRRRD